MPKASGRAPTPQIRPSRRTSSRCLADFPGEADVQALTPGLCTAAVFRILDATGFYQASWPQKLVFLACSAFRRAA